MSRNEVVHYSVIIATTLFLVVACQSLKQPPALQQATTVLATPTSTQVVPTEVSPSLPHTLLPTVSVVPTSTTKNESNMHVVLTYRVTDSTGSPCTNDFVWDPGCFGIPGLLVYENGLVLFVCRDEGWPKICQNYISSARVAHLLDDLAAADFFGEYRIHSANVGPHSSRYLAVRTEELHGVLRWSSNSFYLSPVPESISSVQETLEAFLDEVQINSQLYKPEYAIILARGCQCPPPPDAVWGEEGGYVDYLYNYCDDLDSFPEWPFEFYPPNELHSSWHVLGFLQPVPVSVLASAIPDMTCVPSCTPICRSACSFRDRDTFLTIQIRPYLPGETIESGHSRNHRVDWGEVDFKLPRYPMPDLQMTYPTPLPQFTVTPELTPTSP